MRITETCRDCLLSRVRFEAELCTEDTAIVEEAVRASRTLLDSLFEDDVPAPVIASAVHRCCYRTVGAVDPYRTLKYQDTRTARDVVAKVRHLITDFPSAIRAAVIGNAMDYGVMGHTIAEDFISFFKAEFEKGLFIDDSDEIAKAARRVVYFMDNTGESFFDRILIEELKHLGAYVTVAVKHAPILNDVTLDEARDAGIDEVADHLTTTGGGAEIGVNLKLIPDDLKDAIQSSTLIISKGLANYESLSDYSNLPPVAYLLVAKCDPIAEKLGVPKGAKIAHIIR
ncbi:ARMT1-like domain-containing protein [Methanocalculus sp.]|uniref:damage-control phosphatase ARMT1 family protein n=1 Tax=Methanocalculus sp. TaxID=2004547 RepID=UPI002624F044|nr:ARMT1-like domain-containing protein [Methanocalculus sp.]MDG6249450.1 ARMT1-like domain-containing protein [Methanocalculus sp.]